jgi:large subunit ribosomal protein L16
MIIRFWRPRKVKYESRFKQMAILNSIEKKNIDLVHGSIGLKAMKPGLLTYNQLEATRRVINRFLKREGNIIIRVRPETLLTKKPIGVRMGKGKGKESEWVCKIKSGTVILELSGVSLLKGKEALKYGLKKLPIASHIVMYSL